MTNAAVSYTVSSKARRSINVTAVIFMHKRERGGDIPLLVQFRQLLALWSFVRRGLTSRERERDA